MGSRDLKKLSALQKRILKTGLMAYYRTQLDLAHKMSLPGSFTLKLGRDIDMETGRLLPILDHRARVARRAATGLSVRRLILRGLVEFCSRGR
jgi:hypothetical protein